MRSGFVIVGCGLLALVATVRFVSGPTVRGEPLAPNDPDLGFALVDDPPQSERGPSVAAPLPNGRPIPMRVRPVQAGIPIGNGVFLPPLNGVRVEDGIPPIRRNRRWPPPGPVVATLRDGQGQEWYLHLDGSHTSCSYASVTLADGTTKTIVSTQHGAVLPESRGSLTR